jgi:hypothetical protein
MPIQSAAEDKIAEQNALLSRRSEQFAALRVLQKIHEEPFTSEVPFVGPLIAGLRQLWHDFAVRWSVLPLAHQQSSFNAQLGDLLGLLMQMDDQLRVALHLTQQELQRTKRWNAELERDVAENIREINELAERLATVSRAAPPDSNEAG